MTTVAASQSAVCPLCGGAGVARFSKHGHQICDCAGCGHRFAALQADAAHVGRVYSDRYFDGGGDGYSDYLGEAHILTAHGARYGALLKRYTKPGTVLDVGAAAGFILKGLMQHGWHGVALEPNAAMVAHARDNLGLEAVVGTLEDYRTDQRFDLISMVQVIGHFYDIRRALAAAAALTAPGGYWLIEGWNRDSLMARALSTGWHEYSPPSVLHWFSPNSLGALVAQFGFKEVARGRPAKKLNGGHAKSLLKYKLGTGALGKLAGAALNVVPDKLTLPYPNFDLFWTLYRHHTQEK
jgi:SAM-dependent methyltransferase